MYRWNVLCLGLILAACSEQVPAPDLGQNSGSSSQIVTAQREPTYEIPFGAPAGVSEQQATAVIADGGKLDYELGRKMAGYDPAEWQQADATIRAFIEQHKDHPAAFLLRQSAAVRVLMGTPLLADSITPEKQEAITFYLHVLARNGFPDPRLVGEALESVEGFIPAEEAAEIRRQTVANTNRYLVAREERLARKGPENEEATPITQRTVDEIAAARDAMSRAVRSL